MSKKDWTNCDGDLHPLKSESNLMRIRNVTRPSRRSSGHSAATAVVITAANFHEGVEAENRYLERQFGVAWRKVEQAHLQDGDKHFDRVTIELERRQRIIWFDITSFMSDSDA